MGQKKIPLTSEIPENSNFFFEKGEVNIFTIRLLSCSTPYKSSLNYRLSE